MSKVEQVEIFAWVGENEFAPHEVGLKQAIVPAGTIPMAATNREKMEKYWPQAEAQAAMYGRRIRLCRFVFAETIRETAEGK